MKHWLGLCALAALVLGGCRSIRHAAPTPSPATDGDTLATRLDRGSWMVSQATRISMVMEQRPNLPPRHIGYLIASDYRQMRGGPSYRMYRVTTKDREEQIGHIDQIGRATRYEPQRNGTFSQVDVGVGRIEDQVAAIFGLDRAVSLEPTTERRLAFLALDRNGDGLLGGDEMREYGARLTQADTNRDGLLDYEEFSAIDVL
jgi:hypothetical protein